MLINNVHGRLPAVWAATTKNSDYIRMQGMKRIVNDAPHRQELVAGNMVEHLIYRERILVIVARI
jgi:hypothetical protein